MGNKPFTVGLSTDNSTYTAGQTIQGTIYIAVQSGLGEVPPATSLNIALVGTEYSVIHYTRDRDGRGRDNNGFDTTEDEYERSSHDVFRVEHSIVNFQPGQLRAGGRYEFPFKMVLPNTLPSSMQGQHGRSHCSVEYKLTAILRGAPGQQGMFWSQPPQASSTLIMKSSVQASTKPPTPFTVGEDDLPVRTCCGCCGAGCCNFNWCRKSGHMDMHVQVSPQFAPSNHPFAQTITVARGGMVPVSMAARNRSTTNIKNIRLKLVQTVEWTANMRSISDSTTVYSHDIAPESLGADLERMRHDPTRYMTTHHFGTPEATGLVTPPSLHTRTWHELGTLPIPHGIIDTYAGTYVKVRHVLSVTIQTEGCCVTNPSMEILCNIVGEGPTEAVATATVLENDANETFASAPSEKLDTAFYSSDQQAQALPADWFAETADVVTIPMAKAELL